MTPKNVKKRAWHAQRRASRPPKPAYSSYKPVMENTPIGELCTICGLPFKNGKVG